jgi:hypothetical protein
MAIAITMNVGVFPISGIPRNSKPNSASKGNSIGSKICTQTQCRSIVLSAKNVFTVAAAREAFETLSASLWTLVSGQPAIGAPLSVSIWS